MLIIRGLCAEDGDTGWKLALERFAQWGVKENACEYSQSLNEPTGTAAICFEDEETRHRSALKQAKVSGRADGRAGLREGVGGCVEQKPWMSLRWRSRRPHC